jgi:hypothetical protein
MLMVLNLRTFIEDNLRMYQGAKCLGKVNGPQHENPDFDDPFFDDYSEAQAFCNGSADGIVCPMRDACLQYALTNNCQKGVWGGMTPKGRRALRKRWPPDKLTEPREEWTWMPEHEAVAGINLPDDPEDYEDDGA